MEGEMIQSGRMYVIECLGPMAGNRWLNGETANGRVDLAPDTTDANSGTKWLATLGSSGWQFRCIGSQDSSQYLNGVTQQNGVFLDGNANDSGTYWTLNSVSTKNGADFNVVCNGTAGGNTYLNGDTTTDGCDLAANTQPSGTTWRFYELAIY
jgi:hypothetical protein